MELFHKRFMPLLVLLFLCCISLFISGAQALNNNTISAIYVFGDSTVDPGNNNYINTVMRSNFSPYGRDFVDQMPTGRFTNGRLTTDFLASYMGVKEYIPPYLDPTLSMEELITGVSFASAGSGFDPLTPTLANVIDIPKQVEYFKEYKKRLELAIGKEKMEKHIKKAGFVISAGTNDFVVNYFIIPLRRKTYTVSAYQQFVFQKAKELIQDLQEEGARKIVVTGLPPMGCLPAVITLNSEDALLQRGCIDKYSTVAREYNQMLQNELKSMQFGSANNIGAKIYYIDIYGPMIDMIQGPAKLGFDEVTNGCCGTGYVEAGFLCNPKSYVCPDASKYVFWDAIHPTEKTYNNIFNACLNILDDIIKE